MRRHLLRATLLATLFVVTSALPNGPGANEAEAYCLYANRDGTGATFCTP